MCGVLLKFMRFGTNLAFLLLFVSLPASAGNTAFDHILRKAALDNGFLPPDQLYDDRDSDLAETGRKFFGSSHLSLNANISCKTCHLSEFSSGDGIPNAVGVGGKGQGRDRALSGGRIIPRNTLPLWGSGGPGFDTFFWDGKVDYSNGSRISPFGNEAPASDPLVIAVHLPAVEIGEMLTEDKSVSIYKKETTESASEVYGLVADRLREHEQSAVAELAAKLQKDEADIKFLDIARSIASFIRSEFRVRSTRFHDFLFDEVDLTSKELKGGLIFFGKGKCSNCHSGPYLSDLKFHAIPLPQLGFGKNGFGVDYGRFNVTFEPTDLYKFRTPPLYNVARTAPYGHSGSVKTLREAIEYHYDPLKFVEIEGMDKLERHEYYKRLSVSAQDILDISYLTDGEVDDLVQFCETLSFN